MAQNPDEHTQRERTGLALKIGGLLTLAGIVIILGPLVYSILAPFQPPPEIDSAMSAAAYLEGTTHPLTRLNSNFGFFLFTGCILLAFGLTFLFSHAVDYSAVGAGKMKIFGLEMPVEFQGGAAVLIILLAGMGFSVDKFDLTKLDDTWGEWSELHGKLGKASEENKALSNKNTALSIANDQLVARNKTVEEILRTGGQNLELQFNCNDINSRPMVVRWERRNGGIEGNLLASSETDTPIRQNDGINPFKLLGQSPSLPYTIVANAGDFPDYDAGERNFVEVISASFEFRGGNLVASIWPGDVSLRDLCDSQKRQAFSTEEVVTQVAPPSPEITPADNAVNRAAQAKAGF